MKKYLFLLIVIIAIGCTKEKQTGPESLLLLRIDYMTHEFKGGIEIDLNAHTLNSDTLPISVNYDPPGDFGNITLTYEPTNQMVFDGSIIWMGTGQVSYPINFEIPANFSLLSYELSLPDLTEFQTIWNPLESYEPTNYQAIWSSIDDLELVEEYLVSNMKIGLFLYTPAVGAMDPYATDWYIIMEK